LSPLQALTPEAVMFRNQVSGIIMPAVHIKRLFPGNVFLRRK